MKNVLFFTYGLILLAGWLLGVTTALYNIDEAIQNSFYPNTWAVITALVVLCSVIWVMYSVAITKKVGKYVTIIVRKRTYIVIVLLALALLLALASCGEPHGDAFSHVGKNHEIGFCGTH